MSASAAPTVTTTTMLNCTVLLRPGMSAPERMPNHLKTTIDKVSIVNVGGKDRIIFDHGMIDPSYENSLLIVNFEKDNVITRKLFLYHKVNGIFIFEYMCEQSQFKFDYDSSLSYDVGDIVMHDNRHFVCLQKIRGQAPCFGAMYITTQRYSKQTYVTAPTGHVYRAKTPIAADTPLTDPAWLLQPWKYIDDVGVKFPTWWHGGNGGGTTDRMATSFMVNPNSKLTFSPTSGGALYLIDPPQLVGIDVMDRSHLPAHMQRCFKSKDICKVYYCHALHHISPDVTKSAPSLGFEMLIYVLPDGVYEPDPGVTPIPLEDHHYCHVGTLMILTGDTCPLVMQSCAHESLTFRQICVHASLRRDPVYSQEYLAANRAIYDAVTTSVDPDEFTHERMRKGLCRIQSGDTTVDDPDKIRRDFLEWTSEKYATRNQLACTAKQLRKDAEKAAEVSFQRVIKARDEFTLALRSRVMRYISADTWLIHPEQEIYDSISWDIKGEIITASEIQHLIRELDAMLTEVCKVADGALSAAFQWVQTCTEYLRNAIARLPKTAIVKKLKVAPARVTKPKSVKKH